MRGLLITVALGSAAVLAGCPGRGGPTGGTPPFVGTDTGDLGEPPGPSPDAFGLAWMEQLYPRFRDDWAAFINDCRLRLPATDPLNSGTLAAVITLEIDRGGELRAAALQTASGNADFDGVAMQIVRDAAPYPAPPVELVSDDDRVHLRWGFHRDQRLAGPATAAIERIEWPLARAVPKMLAGGNLTGAARRIDAALRANKPDERGLILEMSKGLATAAIRRALASTDAGARRAGVAAARRAKLRAVADELRALAAGATDPALQREAVRALGAIGDADVVPALLIVVGERAGAESAATSAAAIDALATLGKGAEARGLIAGRLAGPDKEERAHALAVAAQIGIPEGLAALAAVAGNAATPRQERVAACAAVGLAGAAGAAADRDIALKALRRGLDSADAGVRAACAQGVAVVAGAGGRAKASYWRVLELLKDRDERVRAGALLAAIRLEPEQVGKELYVVSKEKSPVVLAAYAEGLAVLPGPAALDRLAGLARHPDLEVRRRAAATLGRRTDKPARDLLAGMIGDPDPEIQLQALAALEGDAVAPLAESPDPEVRTAAFARLVAARGPDAAAGMLCTRLGEDDLDEAEAARIAGAWLLP